MKEKKFDVNKKIIVVVVWCNGRIQKKIECEYTEELENSLKETIKVLNPDIVNDKFIIEYKVICGFNLGKFIEYTNGPGITYNIKYRWFSLQNVNCSEIVTILNKVMLELPIKTAEYIDHTIDPLSQFGGTWNIEMEG